jgi:hypothetical protein
VPVIPSWCVYANLQRLAQAKEDNFARHPDDGNHIAAGSPLDITLCGRHSGRVTNTEMQEWMDAYPWAHDKSITYGIPDPADIPKC